LGLPFACGKYCGDQINRKRHQVNPLTALQFIGQQTKAAREEAK
jgi:hypothetical protein